MRSLTVVFALCLALGGSARADEWAKTFTLAGRPELRVETSDANIHLDTWNKSTIEARVSTMRYRIGEGGITIYDHQIGDSVELEVRFPHDVLTSNLNYRRVDIEIHMPREGRLTLRTLDGAIQLCHFKGSMELESGDGHQEIEAVDGTLRARVGEGSIRASGRFDALSLTAEDGHIEAQALTGSTMNSAWSLQTGAGDVTLQLPEAFAANLDLRTTDGHIDVGMPVKIEGKRRGKYVHGKLNGGGNLLTIHTGSGSLRLEKL